MQNRIVFVRECESGLRSRIRSRRRSFLGVVRVWFITTLGAGVGLLVRLRYRKSNWSISYIALLYLEFLLKLYNFCWNFCWNRDFLLCITIFIDFNSQISFPLVRSRSRKFWKRRSRKFWKVGVGCRVGNFGKVGVGVGYVTSDSETWCECHFVLTFYERGARFKIGWERNMCSVKSAVLPLAGKNLYGRDF